MRRLVVIALLPLTLMVAPWRSLAHETTTAPKMPSGASLNVSDSARALTRRLLDLHTAYHSASGGDSRHAALRNLIAAAAAREQYLGAIIDEHPGEVIRAAVSARLRAALPADVQRHLEEEVTLDGELDVLHEDNATGGRYVHWLRLGGSRLSMHFAAADPRLRSGDLVRVRGMRVRQALALGDGAGQVTVLAAASPYTIGAQKTAVLRISFDNQPGVTSVSAEQAREVTFGADFSASSFFYEASYEQTWLTGDVFGPFTLPASYAASTCNYYGIASAAEQAAAAAGVNLSSYTRRVYAFPKSNACGWWGLGTVGGSPSKAWVNGGFSIGVVTHELGHNLGLYHSHALECGSVVIGGGCSSLEYGDTLDVMGGPLAHFNAAQKERLGWLNAGSSPPITTVAASGLYAIDPYEPPGANPKALKVRTPSGDWYYVEYRQPIGYDAPFVQANPNIRDGVVLHFVDNGSPNSIYLLDLTPETGSWWDPALGLNQTFVDPAAGLSISLAWVNSSGAGVNVALGSSSCVRRNPTVTVSPAQQQGAPGTPVTYTVAVKNNDTGCAATTFSQSASVPTGWNAAFASLSLTIASGGTQSTSLNVASPVSAASGLYSVTPSAVNSSLPAYAASTTASYSVAGSNGGGSGTFSDQFERSDSTVLGNGWLETGGDLSVQSGQLTSGPTKTLHRAVLPGLVGPTQNVSATFAAADSNGPQFGLIARYQDPNNYYACSRQTGGSSRLRISKVVNGVETILKAVSVPNPAKDVSFRLRCIAQGSSLTLEYDGASRVTATDSTFATGSVGILMGYPNRSGTAQRHRADDFTATVQ